MDQRRHTVIPAVFIFLRRENEIFLIRRAHTGYRDGSYVCPAGHIEAAEGALAAGVREAKEEVGVTLAVKDLHLVHVRHHPSQDADTERVSFFFETYVWQDEPHNAEPSKCDDAAWFALDALPDDIEPTFREGLQHSLAGEVYSDAGFAI